MDFKEAYCLPIGDNVEKKNGFDYLSWVFAVKHLRENYPKCKWEILTNSDNQPYFTTPKGCMVGVTVLIDEMPFTQWMAVTDFRNKAIPTPDCADISNAIQRCLVKAIGIATGIGLPLYAGEDIPKELPPEPETITLDQQTIITDTAKESGVEVSRILAFFKINKLEDMLASDFDSAITKLKL